MKTLPCQALESSHCSLPTLNTRNDLSISIQNNVSHISNAVINNNHKIQAHQTSAAYLQLVQQAERYMMEQVDHQISIGMLCSALYVSRRTLHYAFQAVVGVSPMTYLKIQRMKQVHHQLEQAHPLATTVFDTACQWGFYHMGHFSRDYKEMFGESPAETLKRESAYHYQVFERVAQ